jgi:hypothetical protein
MIEGLPRHWRSADGLNLFGRDYAAARARPGCRWYACTA